MNRIGQDVLRNRRLLASTLFSCVSLFLVANASPIFAQGDGSAAMRTITPFIGYEETFQWSDVPEILAEGAKPSVAQDNAAKDNAAKDNAAKDNAAKKDAAADALEYSWASDLFFEKEIWQLQFSYKNIRTIDVSFPTKGGKLETKRVWYLVYSVTNTGERLKAEIDSEVKADVSQTFVKPGDSADAKKSTETFQFPSNNLSGVYKPSKVTYAEADAEGAIRFVPRFVFATASLQDKLVYERKADGLFYGQKRGAEEGVYYDEFLPLANIQIAKKESRGQELLDSVRMSNRSIKPGETVWGVATWVGVDPRVDKFSIYISGLTNALRWEISEDAYGDENAPVGAGRDVMRKVLKINFFNPGDEAHSGGKEIYNNLPGELDYQWIYL